MVDPTRDHSLLTPALKSWDKVSFNCIESGPEPDMWEVLLNMYAMHHRASAPQPELGNL